MTEPDVPAVCVDERAAFAQALEAERRTRRDLEADSAAKSDLLATVSHELRSPIGAVLGYTQIVRSALERIESPDVHEYLDRIEQSAAAMNDLVDELLLYARLDAQREAVTIEEIDLEEVARGLSRLAAPLAAQRGLALTIRVEGAAGAVLTDRGKLLRIAGNLLTNAVKFTRAGSVSCEFCLRDDLLMVRVVDTGTGIAREHVPHLFEPFWRVPGTGVAGTGLGLHITRRLVDLLGGALEVASEPGRGSTFVAFIPVRCALSWGAATPLSATVYGD